MDEIVSITQDIENLNLAESFICSPEEIGQYLRYGNSSFKLLHINIRSINCNFDGLLLLLHRIQSHLDIIILSECWLSKCPSLPSLPGYNSFASDYKTQNEGVVAYVKAELTCNVVFPKFADANCLLLNIDDKIAVVALYRSPSIKNIDRFLNSLDSTLNQLNSFPSIVIIGDININIVPNSNDPNLDDYLNLTASHAMLPAHVLPTRLTSCLDHVIFKSPFSAVSLVLDSLITDHAPTLFCIAMSTRPKSSKSSTIQLDIPSMIQEIDKTDFSSIVLLTDANYATQILVDILSSIVQKHTLKVIIPNKKRILKPWITPGLLKCIRHRDRLYRRQKKEKDNDILKITFTRYRNFCNNLLKRVKREYERCELQKAKNNPKATWNLVKKITNLNRKHSPTEELLKLAVTPELSVNLANKFFANVGSDLASDILLHLPTNTPTSPHTTSSTVIHSDSSPLGSMALLPTDCREIEYIILNLKDNCAVGWDGIPTSVIKGAKNTLIPILNHIFNLCLLTGTFPHVFKKALVHPIYKSGDRHNINNYRPISVLSVLSKVLEKIINRRLVNFLSEKGILASNQYGFRSGRSTEDAVIELTTTIVRNFDRGLKTVGIFLDLSKAFDTVSIPILLDKLEQLGIRGSVNHLFGSYLSDRRQIVFVDNISSDEELITFGVPQGSVLGPTLFLVYINELCKLSLPNCNILTYADDTALLISGENWEKAQLLAEASLNVVLNWLSLNLLTLNVTKTKFITFSPTMRTQPTSFSLRAHTCLTEDPNSCLCLCPALERSLTVKYLGVYIDSTLSWTTHIESTVSRVRKLIFVFKNLRSVADFSCLKTVYFALAQSVLSYCISAWGGAIKTQMLRVERAQRAVLKVMTSKPRRFPTGLLYSLTEVLTVRQLFVLATVLRRHSHLPFYSNLSSLKRRSDLVCRIEPRRTAVAGRHFHYLSSSLYNRVNKILNIYPLPKHKCKNKCMSWLLSLSYEETEHLLVTFK